ncbi:MFS transporter [Streptomyces sp. V4-01]|uniref:MFS transporter n=1 Tax=Actinacidiphila polyblastidii TaxID=3110430 RepID=A0ABU7PHF2_9ACTN|nr:MFS transporter [Streptomyces sp. V4-01]
MAPHLTRLAHRTGAGAGNKGSFDRRLLPPMMLGSVLNPVNSSIISVSLVPIGAAFGAPPAQTAWLISALYLATAIGQPVVGRLIDLHGPRRLFLAGTALTGVAGLVGVLAPNLGVLIAARVLLGFGTCAGYPAAMNLIRSEAARTGRDSPAGVLTALAVTNQTVAVIGPSLGGLLIGLGGWRATLAVNIPLALAGLLLGALRLPRTPPAREGGRGAAALDLPGMALFSATLVSLLLFLMDPRLAHWWLPVLTAVLAAAFARRELRLPEDPFIDLRVLAGNGPLLATYGRALLGYVVSYAFLYGYTQWLEEGRGLSASQTGLAQLPLFATAIAVSAAFGRRAEIRRKLLVGGVFQVAACALLLFLGAGGTVWLLVAVAVVFGVPQGLNSLALQNAVYHQAQPERIGSSAGLLRTFGYLGAIVASAANGVFFPHRADTAGMHHLAWFLVAVSVAFLVVTVADRSLARIGVPSAPPGPPAPAASAPDSASAASASDADADADADPPKGATP